MQRLPPSPAVPVPQKYVQGHTYVKLPTVYQTHYTDTLFDNLY